MSLPKITRGRAIFITVVLGFLIALLWSRADLGGGVERCVAFFRHAGPGPFFLAMALLPAVGFPVWPFVAAAGPVFGPTMGVGGVIACALLALGANMALCYWIAARAVRPWLQGVLTRRGYSVPQIPSGSEWEITLIARLIPGPPFCLQSYLLGLARVPFRIYLTVSMLVLALFATGTILAGDALMRRDPWALALGGVICVVAGVAIHRVRRRLKAGVVG